MSLHYEDTGGENPFLDEEAGPNDNNHDNTHKQGDLLLQNTSLKTASDRSLGSTHSTTTTSPDHNARKLMVMIGAMACLVVTLIIIITVSVTLAVQGNNSNSSSNKSSDQAVAVTEGPTSVVLTEAPTEMISGGDDRPLETSDNNNVVAETTAVEQVPSFSSDILQTYESRAALEADLTVAAMEIVRAEIAQNMELLHLFQEAAAADAPAPSNRGGGFRQRRRTQEEDISGLFQPSTTSKTNNRERTVDEADTVKEDGNYVYAAYGDYLVVWDRQGNLAAQDRMAAPPADAFGTVLPALIQGVQLTPNHVLVFCGGYSTFKNDPQALTTATNETKLHVYTRPTPDNPVLARVAEQTIHGSYHSSRVIVNADSDSSIQGTVHIVTGAEVNLYTQLQEPLSAIYFTGAANNRTRYQEEATALATDTVVPKFVSQLADEMLQSGTSSSSSGMPQVMKINNWKKEATAGEDSSSVGITSWDKALHSYVQVLSIHPDALPTSEFIVDGLEFSKSAFMSPLSIHDTHVYATDHHMVVAVEPFQYDLETSALTEEVCLVHLKVATSAQDADSDHVVVTTNFHSVALLEGRLAGDDTFASRHHSIDIQGDDLRVAITHQTSYPMDRVVEVCGPNESPFFEDPCMTPEAWALCHDMVLFDECVTVSKTECPFQFTCDEAAEEKSPSSTRNYVMVLSVKESGEMVELGGIMLGEDHEKITSVHLAKDFSYVTTSFLQSQGPFYVLSLPQEGAPAISATLQLDEVVSYLQPLNEAATLLVGIGQNSTGTGALEQDTGAMVSVFDVADPQAPVVLASRMLNREDGSKSSTHAQIDSKAVQYTSSGMLIIPMQLTPVATMPTEDAFAALNITDLGSFHVWDLPEVFEGFIVLDVSDPTGASGISEVLRVNHANPSGRCNYCDGMLQNHRAFSYEEDGSVMTIYNHKVISSNLTTASQNWALNITLIGQDMNCCL